MVGVEPDLLMEVGQLRGGTGLRIARDTAGLISAAAVRSRCRLGTRAMNENGVGGIDCGHGRASRAVLGCEKAPCGAVSGAGGPLGLG